MTEQESKALAYVESKGWNYRQNDDQLVIETCPYCGKENFHFYMCYRGPKDGLHDCKVCGKTGSLRLLMEHEGDRSPGVTSSKELLRKEKEALPDYERAHKRLLENQDALNYLQDVRGYSMEVIERQKLGLTKRWFPELKFEAAALLIPYLVGDNIVFAKYRSIPPTDKAFDGPRGYDPPLYNEQNLVPGMEEVLFVEGEGDVLSLMTNSVDYAFGVPGANVKKASWVVKLDKVAPKKIYIMYDNDPVGQAAAYKMALRIGINKVYNILLPEFWIEEEDGTKRKGKDINEWFQAGHTLEDFQALKAQATLFNVAGVTGLEEAMQKLEDDIDAKGGKLISEFQTPWVDLNKKFGGADRGDLVMVIAEEKRGKTTFAMNWLDDLVAKGESGLLYCLEMPEYRLARKWVSYITETDDSPAQNDEEALLRGKAMKEAIKEARGLVRERAADLLFGYTKEVDPDICFDTIRQAVRRYGLSVVVFDNLQHLADHSIKNFAHRTAYLSQLSKRFKSLAMELGILIILIVQPKRVGTNQIVDANDSDGSSQIQKDCDTYLALHRTMKGRITAEDFEAAGQFMDEVVTFEPQTLVRVSRARYAPGGDCTLWFYGNISKFVDMTEHQKREAEKEAAKFVQPNDGIPTENVDTGI